jgi:hypothetical protein
MTKYPEAHKSLYEVSGDITDANTVLINRDELRHLIAQARDAALEEAAKVCSGRIGGAVQTDEWWSGFKSAMKQCANTIRSLKEQVK